LAAARNKVGMVRQIFLELPVSYKQKIVMDLKLNSNKTKVFSRLICLLILSFIIFSSCKEKGTSERQERNEELFTEGHPRAFFFRNAEVIQGVDYADWIKTFNRLGGIIGKCQNEEIVGISRNISYFTRFKEEYPRQIVLLHYNGNARDPRDDGSKFHAGHWLYFEGNKILDDLPAEGRNTEGSWQQQDRIQLLTMENL
jgi:hypothetical protein